MLQEIKELSYTFSLILITILYSSHQITLINQFQHIDLCNNLILMHYSCHSLLNRCDQTHRYYNYLLSVQILFNLHLRHLKTFHHNHNLLHHLNIHLIQIQILFKIILFFHTFYKYNLFIILSVTSQHSSSLSFSEFIHSFYIFYKI